MDKFNKNLLIFLLMIVVTIITVDIVLDPVGCVVEEVIRETVINNCTCEEVNCYDQVISEMVEKDQFEDNLKVLMGDK